MDSPTLNLAQALLALPSITPQDAGCQELLTQHLRAMDFHCQSIPSGPVSNLWARRGNTNPLLCFAGHTDVVPPGPLSNWHSDPFQPALREGFLYGRGAADMKASLAAFIIAIKNFIDQYPEHRGSIALLITSDEEGDATDGTVKVVEQLKQQGIKLDYCIVGEPTSVNRLGDTIKNGRRGTLSGTLIVHGVQGHVAYPQLADNPIHRALPALTELAATEWDRGNAHFPPTAWQISNIHAGTGAGNVIPGELEIKFNFRYAAVSKQADLQERLETVLKKHRLNYTLNWPNSGQPYFTPAGDLVDALKSAIDEVTGVDTELSCTGGTSDGRFIADICPQVVEFGPVNATIHQLNERVAVADLEQLSAIYCATLRRLLVEHP